MRDKLKFLVIIGLCMIIFTACGKESKFNEKQRAILADYIAQTVIKHSEGYETKLVDVSDSPFLLKDEGNTDDFTFVNNDVSSSSEEDVVKTGDSGTSDNNLEQNDDNNSEENEIVSKSQLAAILGFKEGIEAYVNNKKILQEYASSSYVISADKNKKLVEVIFKITNKTNLKVKAKTLGNSIKYKLRIGKKTYYPLLTAIDNDLMYFDKSIKANKTTNAVLLFSVPSESVKEKIVIEIEGKDTSVSLSLH